MKEEVEAYCVRMFDRLGCRDYARFDFRTDDEGVPRLIDANAHPEWGSEGMVATMAAFAGLDYEELLAHIILSARNNPVVRQPTAKGEPVEAVVGADGIRLRPTRPDDVAFVREVESAPDNRDHVEQWSAEEHLTALEADHTVHLIIENEDRDRVGYVVLEGLKSPDKAMLLRRIVVGRKREHIGDRAMTATERYCFDHLGFRRLWLEVHDDNEPARGLYRRHGFREVGQYRMVQMEMEDRQYASALSERAVDERV